MHKILFYHNIEIVFWINIKSYRWRKLNFKNKTPLHLAVYFQYRGIVEVLISKGANIKVKDIIYQNIIV